jgi:predicted DNA-binding transcriptional regulator YafY
MVDVRVTSERFDRAPGFSIKEYLGASFGVFRQAPDEVVETVRVRFDSFAAPHVKERQWHASQRFVELQGGGVEMQMELGNMVEVQRWILGWGAHAVVVAPERLVLQVRASVESMSAVYRAK